MDRLRNRKALSLVELVVVLTILVALAGIVVPMVGGNAEHARQTTTHATLQRLQEAIMNRYLVDVGDQYVDDGVVFETLSTMTLADLLRQLDDPYHPTAKDYDPVYQTGWNGPYLLPTGARYAGANYKTETLATAHGFAVKANSWRDPGYGLWGEPAVLDGWGNPIVIKQEVLEVDGIPEPYWALVSAGPDGTLNTNGSESFDDDNLVVYLTRVAL